jgi:hypothetical protein
MAGEGVRRREERARVRWKPWKKWKMNPPLFIVYILHAQEAQDP